MHFNGLLEGHSVRYKDQSEDKSSSIWTSLECLPVYVLCVCVSMSCVCVCVSLARKVKEKELLEKERSQEEKIRGENGRASGFGT